MSDPLKLIDVNLFGTRLLLEQIKGRDVRLIFSSGEVYGKNFPVVPWSEDGDRMLGPTNIDRWSYSSSKALCEHMIFAMHRSGLVRPTIVRFFNIYGPRQKPNYVVSRSLHRILNGEQPLIYDSGKQTRCMTFVDDAVDCLEKIIFEDRTVGETINVGSNDERTIKEIVRVLNDVTRKSERSEYFDTTKNFGGAYEDITRRVPDVTKAIELLNWRASTNLTEGVRKP